MFETTVSVKSAAQLLGSHTCLDVESLLNSADMAAEWSGVARLIEPLQIGEDTGSVNQGDRRALFYLTRTLKPKQVLEVGTHLGGSTVHIALALERSARGHLTTVDIRDVNDDLDRPWLRYRSAHSPRAMLRSLGLEHRVDFLVHSSLGFFAQTDSRFDLIFLDGDHSAKVVYAEIQQALAHLAVGGYIVLHDYFPRNAPLWGNNVVISGPVSAVGRLLDEGVPIDVRPLGSLPWYTKCGSNVTSLAIVGKAVN